MPRKQGREAVLYFMPSRLRASAARLSQKWSVYLEACTISALQDFMGVKPRTYRTEQSVSASFL